MIKMQGEICYVFSGKLPTYKVNKGSVPLRWPGQVTAAAYGQSGTGLQPVSNQPGSAANSPTKNEEPGTQNFIPTQTFAYDPAGNRLEVTDNGMTTKYQPNAANQYEQIVTGTEVIEPEFDQLGNLLQDDRNIYTWDSDIHLLSVTTKAQGRDGGQTTASFLYDPLHRRIARLENASTLTFFTYNGWNVITEYSITAKGTSPEANHSWTARNTWGEDLSGTHQGASGIGGLLLSVHQPSDFLS